MSDQSQIRRYTLREPQKTDPFLDFQTYHTLVAAVAQTLGVDIARKDSAPILRLIELDEDLPAYAEDAQKVNGKMPYVDKKGTVLYYDPDTQTWKRDETQQKQVVCNPYKDEYAKEQRIICLYLAQAGKFVPFSGGGGAGKWMQLTSVMTSGTVVQAHPVNWSSTGYGVDEGVLEDIRDFTGAFWGLTGEWLRCQKAQPGSGVAWEVIAPGAPWYEGTLTSILAKDGTGTCKIRVRNADVFITVADRFLEAGDSLAVDARIGLGYDPQSGRFVARQAVCS